MKGLAFLEQHNITHRDIKPENVFIHQGVFKIGDFGFATQKSLLQTSLGTYPYMAPEFFSESGEYGCKVDVWAAGVMYHQMLFGELYFIGSSQFSVTQNILKKPYVVSRQISKESKDILERCIEKNPNKRISASEAMKHPLFGGLQGSALPKPCSEKIQGEILGRLKRLAEIAELGEYLMYQFTTESRFVVFYLLKQTLQQALRLLKLMEN